MKPSSIVACVMAVACQVASNSSAGDSKSSARGEDRLPARSKTGPPPVVRPSYLLDDRELLAPLAQDASAWRAANAASAPTANALRSFGPAWRVIASAARSLTPTLLVPRRSYRLVFSARSIGPGEGSLGVKFREAKNATIRTFRELVKSDGFRQYQLEFTAPVCVGQAELFIDLNQAELELSAISLRMREPLSQTQPVTSWLGSFVPEGYGLVFNDEFNAAELDRRKWFTRYIYSSETLDRLNKENQRYADNGNHRVEAGALNLRATRLKLSQPSGINYESGMIRSDFTLTYGFLEARVRMPRGRGVWPAFWLNSDASETGRLSWPPEIDIFEFVNNGKEDKPNQLHISTTKYVEITDGEERQ